MPQISEQTLQVFDVHSPYGVLMMKPDEIKGDIMDNQTIF